MNALEYYLDQHDHMYGDTGPYPQDQDLPLFMAGWNCAIEEMTKRVDAMPFGNDTRASFAVYFQQMMAYPSNTTGGPK